ncbi:hypothetical protein Hanom_Chr01g00057951 [Helianthus anomalus]
MRRVPIGKGVNKERKNLKRRSRLLKNLDLEWTKQDETSRRLTKIEDKLENSETARATAESELEPLKSDMLWLKEHMNASVAESVLNSEELDKWLRICWLLHRMMVMLKGMRSVLTMWLML